MKNLLSDQCKDPHCPRWALSQDCLLVICCPGTRVQPSSGVTGDFITLFVVVVVNKPSEEST